jgi:hypothetical protein
MKRTLIRYKTKPDASEENRRLIAEVFKELHVKLPEGVRYMVLSLDDGSFFHFVETEDDNSSIPQLDAFKEFQAKIRERCAEPPKSGEAMIVGNYRMLEER